MVNATITDADQLDEMNSEIPDAYFEIKDIAFDAERRELTIPFRRWSDDEARLVGQAPPPTGWRRWLFGLEPEKSWEAPWYRWILRIGGADSYRLHDGAGIGEGDLHKILYDPACSLVIIDGNLPVTIEVAVRDLTIHIKETRELLGVARFQTHGDSGSLSSEVFRLPDAG